jgi:hypothetical protein
MADAEGDGARVRAGARLLALGYGLVCHGLFLVAVACMALGLHGGMAFGCGRVPAHWAWLADTALLLQFPLLHSWLLSRPGRRVLTRLAPKAYGRQLAVTSFAIIASLQTMLTFVLWTPTGPIWWAPAGGLAIAWNAAFASAWLFLGKAILDGGIGLQTGAIGWLAVLRGRPPRYPPMPTRGLFARCRQPIYLGFAAILWTAPVWSADHLAIAVLWSTYCVAGPVLKERRFAAIFGEDFAAYRRRVPYLLPFRT